MTLTVAWERSTRAGSELCFASDSRLSSGTYVDCCQKIFAFPRNDGAIAFAGSIILAYPFLLQVLSILKNRIDFQERSKDFSQVPKLIKDTLNTFIRQHNVFDEDDFSKDLRDTSFLVGGWSASNNAFILRRLAFHNGAKEYVLIKKTDASKMWGMPKNKKLKIAFSGDYIYDLTSELKDEFSKTGVFNSLRMDYETLISLCRLLKDDNYTSRKGLSKRKGMTSGKIGGSLQLLKVYRYCNSTHLIVPGLKNQKEHYFQGRQVFKNENLGAPFIGNEATKLIAS